MTHDPGKEPIPQTVEALQEVMARDAETMLEMRREIGDLKFRLNVADRKNLDLWKRVSKLERELAQPAAEGAA